jgi:basic membrane lipoprotein Med (substrate-binding protein (PBP1-ABC) superfamily)
MPGALMNQLNTVNGDNVFSYTQKEEQGGYLAGVAAGLMTKSNIIGMVAGQDYPDIVRTGVGFKEGVLSVNPKVKFLVMYTGDWVDVQKGYEAAKSIIESGADVLWHYTDNAGKGVAKAAQDHKAKKIYIVGQCRDQIEMAPERVITSCRVDHSKLAEKILLDYKAGKLKKGVYEFGIEEGWDVIAPIRNAPKSVEAKVKEALESIKKGKIKVTLTTDPKALTGTRSH